MVQITAAAKAQSLAIQGSTNGTELGLVSKGEGNIVMVLGLGHNYNVEVYHKHIIAESNKKHQRNFPLNFKIFTELWGGGGGQILPWPVENPPKVRNKWD